MTTAPTRATPVLLWSRAALLAGVVLVVSVLGHVAADGLLPGPFALLALLAATTVVSARFLTRQASAVRIVALLGAGQVAVHGVLTLLAGHGSDRPGGSSGPAAAGAGGFVFDGRQAERSGSYFDQVAAMQAAAPAGPGPVPAGAGADRSGDALVSSVGHLVDHLATQSLAMVLAHLGVVAVLGLWLGVGERALWTLLALTTARVRCAVATLVAVVRSGVAGVLLERVRRTPYLRGTGRPVVPLPHLLHHVVAHRGPPALLLPS